LSRLRTFEMIELRLPVICIDDSRARRMLYLSSNSFFSRSSSV